MSFLDNRFVKNTVKASGLILVSTSPYSCGNCDEDPSKLKIAPVSNAPAPAPASDSIPDSVLKEYGTEFYMPDFTADQLLEAKTKYKDDFNKECLGLDSDFLNAFTRIISEELLLTKIEISDYFKMINKYYNLDLRKQLEKASDLDKINLMFKIIPVDLNEKIMNQTITSSQQPIFCVFALPLLFVEKRPDFIEEFVKISDKYKNNTNLQEQLKNSSCVTKILTDLSPSIHEINRLSKDLVNTFLDCIIIINNNKDVIEQNIKDKKLSILLEEVHNITKKMQKDAEDSNLTLEEFLKADKEQSLANILIKEPFVS